MLKYLKIHWIGCLYSILLIGFTVYMFMDTFLISKVYRLEEKTEGQNIIQEKNLKSIQKDMQVFFYMQLGFKIIFGLQWIYADVLELQQYYLQGIL